MLHGEFIKVDVRAVVDDFASTAKERIIESMDQMRRDQNPGMDLAIEFLVVDTFREKS